MLELHMYFNKQFPLSRCFIRALCIDEMPVFVWISGAMDAECELLASREAAGLY